jgi:hypothetical protein
MSSPPASRPSPAWQTIKHMHPFFHGWRRKAGVVLLYCGLYFLYESSSFGALLHDEGRLGYYPLCSAMMAASELTGNRYIFWIGYFALIPVGMVAIGAAAYLLLWKPRAQAIGTPPEKSTASPNV